MTDVPPEMVVKQEVTNPLLVRARIPGRTFALPSLGVFYTHGELDDSVKKGEVLVYPMVTVDEIAMKTPDKLLNGTAIEEVFRRCIPQVQKPMELLALDVDFLLICLRELTYGNEYEMLYTHDCKDAKEHNYIVPLKTFIAGTKKINTRKVTKDYSLILPNEQSLKLTPPKYRQMLVFFQTFDKTDATTEELAEQLIDTTLSLIESVDGIEDKELIREWLHQIPAGYVNLIGEHLNSVSEWGPKTTATVTCKDCGAEVELSLSLNPINFFS